MHTLLVIDKSGSMRAQSIQPDSSDLRDREDFLDSGLDNALGVVYEAAYKYICERAARATRDVVTFIPFDDNAYVRFAAWPVRRSREMLDKMMQIAPKYGTRFNNALRAMHKSVRKV